MDMRGVEESQAFSLFDYAKQEVSELNTLKYLILEEYNLLGAGIRKEDMYRDDIEDDVIRAISKVSETRYVLFVDLLDKYQDDFEESNHAELVFKLVDTRGGIFVSEFKVNTSINPMEIPRDDEDPILLNMSSTSTAIFKAFKKGIKHIRKGVVTK